MLTRIHPFYRDLNQFERAVFGAPTQTSTVRPPADIREDETAYFVEVELPGVPQEAIDIGVERGVLTIRAERTRRRPEASDVPAQSAEAAEADEASEAAEAEERSEEAAPRYRLAERLMGRFERSFRLPDTVDVDAIEAKLEHGVLEVSLPKREAPGTRKIGIRAA